MMKKLLALVVALAMTLSLAAAAIAEDDAETGNSLYTFVPGMSSQFDLLGFDAGAESNVDLKALEPTRESDDELKNIIGFTGWNQTPVTDYFPEVTQKGIEEIKGSRQGYIMTDYMRTNLSITPSENDQETVKIEAEFSLEYLPGQDVIVVYGVRGEDGEIEWIPIDAEVTETGKITFELTKENQEKLDGQESLFTVLTRNSEGMKADRKQRRLEAEANPTEEPTATPEPTEEPTEEPVEEPTEEPELTQEDTEKQTEGPETTPERTEEQTEEPETTPERTEERTEEPQITPEPPVEEPTPTVVPGEEIEDPGDVVPPSKVVDDLNDVVMPSKVVDDMTGVETPVDGGTKTGDAGQAGDGAADGTGDATAGEGEEAETADGTETVPGEGGIAETDDGAENAAGEGEEAEAADGTEAEAGENEETEAADGTENAESDENEEPASDGEETEEREELASTGEVIPTAKAPVTVSVTKRTADPIQQEEDNVRDYLEGHESFSDLSETSQKGIVPLMQNREDLYGKKIYEVVKLEANGFDETLGDVLTNMRFATPYNEDQEIILMLGCVDESGNEVEWFELRCNVTDTGKMLIVFGESCMKSMQKYKTSILMVFSSEFEDSEDDWEIVDDDWSEE